jgi:hypothetical protein
MRSIIASRPQVAAPKRITPPNRAPATGPIEGLCVQAVLTSEEPSRRASNGKSSKPSRFACYCVTQYPQFPDTADKSLDTQQDTVEYALRDSKRGPGLVVVCGCRVCRVRKSQVMVSGAGCARVREGSLVEWLAVRESRSARQACAVGQSRRRGRRGSRGCGFGVGEGGRRGGRKAVRRAGSWASRGRPERAGRAGRRRRLRRGLGPSRGAPGWEAERKAGASGGAAGCSGTWVDM